MIRLVDTSKPSEHKIGDMTMFVETLLTRDKIVVANEIANYNVTGDADDYDKILSLLAKHTDRLEGVDEELKSANAMKYGDSTVNIVIEELRKDEDAILAFIERLEDYNILASMMKAFASSYRLEEDAEKN